MKDRFKKVKEEHLRDGRQPDDTDIRECAVCYLITEVDRLRKGKKSFVPVCKECWKEKCECVNPWDKRAT